MKFLGRKRLRTCLSMLLIVTCLLASFSFYNIRSNAKATKIGTVTGEGVNFRTGPSTSYASLGKLSKGTTGEVLESSGNWHKMSISGKGEGWVSATYVSVTISGYEYDDAFEQSLNAQGFPESYKEGLRGLHALYPNWVFKAQHIKYSWNEVIANESVLKRNLVDVDSKSSWKSTQDGAYNWETGTWIGFDGAGWVAASTEIIQYYMDPRNFLDDIYVFQFIEQSYDVNSMSQEEIQQARRGLELMAKGTYLDAPCDGSTYVNVIMDIAAQTKVSPSTIAATILLEQGRDGHGGCISETTEVYPGVYNHFNVGARPADGMDSVTRGRWFASLEGSYGRPWNTKTKSILGGATHYGEGYVNVGQDTLYLKKFDVADNNPYTHQYMTNIQAAATEGRLVSGAYNSEGRQAKLIFKIPVYSGMPEQACPQPTGNEKPTRGDGGSTGTTTPPSGGGTTGTVTTPSIGNTSYNVSGSTINGISDFSSINVAGLLSKISVSNGRADVATSGGTTKSGDARIGTGDILRLFDSNGAHRATYHIVIYGDTNGDGKVNALDLLRVQKDILGVSKLSGAYSTAGDTNKNGKINALDLLQVQKQILKIGTIKQ